ncbi:DUF3298 and DUF4163 domain-containing protein [Paenibacillus polysaccharolyticus]|uniref:DUF3298 and DUF4163 domain-containing protein n=1 Tax=Paenibacillus polysaccharolyticus TaxID=582692 RepID=UPI00300B5E32
MKPWNSALLAAGILIGGGSVWQGSFAQAAFVPSKVTTPIEIALKAEGNSKGSTSPTLISSKVKQSKVKVLSTTAKVQIKNTEVDLKYPQVSGLNNKKAESAINKVLKNEVDALVADFKKEAKGFEKPTAERPHELMSSYEVMYNENGVISFVTSSYAIHGGANGRNIRNGHTFALSTGKELTLYDVLQNSKSMLDKLSKNVGEQLEAKYNVRSEYKGLDKDQDFYVTPKGVVVFFQQYEYTSRAEGFPEFTFKYKEVLPKGAVPFSNLKKK